jgi:protein-glutamine gamma-glutamyltransferase
MSYVAAHGFSRIVTLMCAMVMATLPFLTLMPIWLTFIVVGIGCWRVIVEQRGLVIIPPLKIRLGLSVLIGALLLATNELGFGLTAATPLFIGFLWIKLLELKARRDYLLTCFLSYFLVAVLLFDQSSLTMCLYAIATLLMISLALVGYHVDAPLRSIMKITGRYALISFPVAVLIFVLFPRLSLSLPNLTGQATSGFADNLSPGDVARMALSEEPVMRVEFPNNDMPELENRYWRGLVLSKTDGRTWSVLREFNTYKEPPQPHNPQAPTVVQNITLEPINQRWLFALDTPELVPPNARLTTQRSILRRAPISQTLRYQVTSRIGEQNYDYDEHSKRIPETLDPRVRQLAAQWRTANSNPNAIIRQAQQYFADNNFSYSLSPGTMDGDDVADFLFNKRMGFCSHYATAFALLMRCAGLPARTVVGFRGGDVNPVGGFLLIRQDHAHMWCEVQIDGYWQRFDPTANIPLAPGETAPAALRNSADNSGAVQTNKSWWMPEWLDQHTQVVRNYWQYAEAKWEGSVMGYDSASQASWLNNLGISQYATPILLSSIIVVCLLAAFIMGWWQREQHGTTTKDPLRLWYDLFCARLAQAGVVRAAHEGPRDFTTRAAAALPQHAALINELGETYIAARYGAVPLTKSQRAQLHAQVKKLPKQNSVGTANAKPAHHIQ